MSPADAARLQAAYRRENRSMLQYAREAALYAGPDQKLLDAVLRIADEERDAIDEFAAVLDSRRVPLPYPGSYPVALTDLNYVAVRSLLPRLIAEQRTDLAALEADAASLTNGEAKAAVQSLAELHQRHLAEMESQA
jgi:hypothetical protein